MGEIKTVDGLEMFVNRFCGDSGIDQSVDLNRCPFCGHLAGYYHVDKRGDTHPIGVVCTNTSCGVMTPKHYQDREAARAAWNRRASTNGEESRE